MIELVKCDKRFWEFVRVLRNDERVKDGFINPTYITEEIHEQFMINNSQHYRIALLKGMSKHFVLYD